MLETTPAQSPVAASPLDATEAPSRNAAEKPFGLSIVVVSFNAAALLERCLQSLEHQAAREGVEVLIVRSARHGPAEEIERLKRRYREARWICEPEPSSVPQLRCRGIAHSRGQVVAFLEDDCIADETWCTSLLSAHRDGDVAIGGVVEPADYAKLLDWAVYFFEYVRFMRPLPKRSARALPGTNVSYKRQVLLDFLRQGDTVRHAPSVDGFYEYFVHSALLRAGRSLTLNPDLVVYNVNSWHVEEVVKAQFHYGRVFAALRVAGYSAQARLRFLALATLLPALQVARIGREVIARRRYLAKAGAAFPWIIVLAFSWSIGELVGYLLGSEKA